MRNLGCLSRTVTIEKANKPIEKLIEDKVIDGELELDKFTLDDERMNLSAGVRIKIVAVVKIDIGKNVVVTGVVKVTERITHVVRSGCKKGVG